MEGLTEGRIVHYVVSEKSGKHRAAIVVNIRDTQNGTCDLFVFSMPQDERGGFFMVVAKHDDGNSIDTWHWIEKA